MGALLRLGEEACVVECERDPPRKLHRHREVRLIEARLPLDRADADRAERPAARHERRDDAGRVRDPPDRARVLRVVRHRLGLGLEIRQELRLAGAEGDLDRMRRDRRRVLRAQLPHELGLLGIRVHGDDPVELVLLVEQVDHEIARERGHRELGDRFQRLFPVEAGDEQLVGLGEEAEVLLGAAAARDVGQDRDGRDDRTILVAHRCGADLQHASLAVALDLAPLADRHLAGLDRALERPARRRDVACAVVVADGDRRPPDALELVVEEDDAVVGVGDRDAERQLRDHRLQLRERVLRLPVEADEVERERDAPRELRDELEVLGPMPAGLRRGDREHAEPPAAGLERDDDERARLHVDAVLLAGARHLLQRPGQRRPMDRLPGAKDLDDRDAAVELDVVDVVDLVEEGGDARIHVRVGDAYELGLAARDVDVAAVGDPGNDELRHPPEQVLVVERLAQLLRRLEEKCEPGARGLGLTPGVRLLRDVPGDVDDELDAAVRREHGSRAERQPPLPRAGARAHPDHGRALGAGQRLCGRQILGRDSRAVGVEDLVPRGPLLG